MDRRQFLKRTGGVTVVTALAGCGGGGDGSGGGSDGSSDGSSEGGSTDGGSDGGSGGSGDGSSDGGSGDGGVFSTEATVTHWPILMYTPPYAVAQENGYFEEEGIKIKNFVGSSGGGTTVRNVVTGGLAFGEVATPAAVNAYYAGAPLKIIAGATNTPGTINWVSPPDSDVTSLSDLEGKTVGYTSAGSVTQNTSALAAKRAEGVSPDKITFKAMGGLSEGLTALGEGSIAAAANLDPIFSKQQKSGKDWQVVFWAKDHIEQFQQTCLIAGRQVMNNNPDVVRGLLRARSRGVQFVRDNPDEAASIYASLNDGYSPEIMRASLKNVKPGDYYVKNQFEIEGLKLIEEGMKNIDLIDRNVEWTKLVDQSFLPETKRVDLSKAE